VCSVNPRGGKKKGWNGGRCILPYAQTDRQGKGKREGGKCPTLNQKRAWLNEGGSTGKEKGKKRHFERAPHEWKSHSRGGRGLPQRKKKKIGQGKKGGTKVPSVIN